MWPPGGLPSTQSPRPFRGPSLGPPLLGVGLAAQLQMIASGGGSAEVRAFEAGLPAGVGGAEVSVALESGASPMWGSRSRRARGALWGVAGVFVPAQGSTRPLFPCKFSRESPLSAPLGEGTGPQA